MTPFFFGSRERRLFGIYTPARGGDGVPRAALLCQPWGQEYLRAHRAVRHLGELLARAGVHVLRFDYHGTGDSAGDLADQDLAGWEGDVESALEELRDVSGAARVGLAGLRLGGTLAARVAARRPDDVEALALWDPVVSGAEYAAELTRSAQPLGPGGASQVDGFPLTPAFAAALPALELAALVPALPARMLVVTSSPLPSHAALAAALAARPAGPVDLERLEADPSWVEERSTGVGALPVHLLHRIAAWWTA